jgi:hypothetical protein
MSREPRRPARLNKRPPLPPPRFPERRHEYGIPGFGTREVAMLAKTYADLGGAYFHTIFEVTEKYPALFGQLMLVVIWAATEEAQHRKVADEYLQHLQGSWEAASDRHSVIEALTFLLIRHLKAARETNKQAGGAGEAVVGSSSVTVPLWLVASSLVLAIDSSYGILPRRKGRHAQEATRFRDRMIDAVRASAVRVIRDEMRTTYERCFEIASDYLDGSFAAGTSENMRRSWVNFKKRNKREPNPGGDARLVLWSLERLLGPRGA